jgi:hypothetical protein
VPSLFQNALLTSKIVRVYMVTYFVWGTSMQHLDLCHILGIVE